MTSTAKRTRQTESAPSKRDAILMAALETFAERGVNGVAVPEIAERAAVGTGTIYRYFRNKEALVNALYCEEKRALRRHLTEDLDPDGDPKALFDAFWARLVVFARERPAAFRFLELQDHLAYLDTDSLSLEHRVLSPIRDTCAELQDKGVFRADIRPEVIMTLIWGAFVQLFKTERAGYLRLAQGDLEAARDACWRMCTSGE